VSWLATGRSPGRALLAAMVQSIRLAQPLPRGWPAARLGSVRWLDLARPVHGALPGHHVIASGQGGY